MSSNYMNFLTASSLSSFFSDFMQFIFITLSLLTSSDGRRRREEEKRKFPRSLKTLTGKSSQLIRKAFVNLPLLSFNFVFVL